jgi:hypothetical protein
LRAGHDLFFDASASLVTKLGREFNEGIEARRLELRFPIHSGECTPKLLNVGDNDDEECNKN